MGAAGVAVAERAKAVTLSKKQTKNAEALATKAEALVAGTLKASVLKEKHALQLLGEQGKTTDGEGGGSFTPSSDALKRFERSAQLLDQARAEVAEVEKATVPVRMAVEAAEKAAAEKAAAEAAAAEKAAAEAEAAEAEAAAAAVAAERLAAEKEAAAAAARERQRKLDDEIIGRCVVVHRRTCRHRRRRRRRRRLVVALVFVTGWYLLRCFFVFVVVAKSPSPFSSSSAPLRFSFWQVLPPGVPLSGQGRAPRAGRHRHVEHERRAVHLPQGALPYVRVHGCMRLPTYACMHAHPSSYVRFPCDGCMQARVDLGEEIALGLPRHPSDSDKDAP